MTEVVIRGREVEPSPARSASGRPSQPAHHGGFLQQARAFTNPEWLPDATPELTQYKEQHNAFLDRAREVNDAIRAAERRFAVEDGEYTDALQARARGEDAEVPALTPPEERAAELAQLEAEALAIGQVLEQFCRGVVGEIESKYDEWTAALDEEDDEAAARVEEARAALAEAEAGVGSRVQLRTWLQREAGRHPIFKKIDGARHIAYGDLAGVAGPQRERDPEPTLGDPSPTPPAMSPEARAQLLAERAARLRGEDSHDETGDDA